VRLLCGAWKSASAMKVVILRPTRSLVKAAVVRRFLSNYLLENVTVWVNLNLAVELVAKKILANQVPVINNAKWS